MLLTVSQISLSFFLKNSKGIDSLPSTHNVHSRWLAFLAKRAKLNQRGHVKRFDQTLKSHLHGCSRFSRRALSEHFVQLLAGSFVRFVLFVLLLRGWRSRHLLGRLSFGFRFRRFTLCWRGRRCWRRRRFFYHRHISAQFTFRSKSPAVTYNEFLFLFGHRTSVVST